MAVFVSISSTHVKKTTTDSVRMAVCRGKTVLASGRARKHGDRITARLRLHARLRGHFTVTVRIGAVSHSAIVHAA